MRYILFILFVIGLVPIIQADDAQFASLDLTYDRPVKEITQIKDIDLTEIEDGSRINSVSLNILVQGNENELCWLVITDSYLDDYPITDEFLCSGTFPIELNQNGVYAFENQLFFDKISFQTERIKDGSVVNSFISRPDVSYNVSTYYAKIENNIVTNVIVADSSFISTQDGTWVKTYRDDSIRGNYAGIGYTYDSTNDVFYPPTPYPSWILNQTDWQWESPTPYPSDGSDYYWDEETISWVLVE